MKLLIVDDDEQVLRTLTMLMKRQGYDIITAQDGMEGLAFFMEYTPDIVLTDLQMPRMGGIDLLEKIRQHDTEIPVLIMTAFATIDGAVRAMKHGADDYVSKPFDVEEISIKLRKALDIRLLKGERDQLAEHNRYLCTEIDRKFSLIGSSEAMWEIEDLIRKVAPHRTTVLIEGESGVGKELVARLVHKHGDRRQGPFVKVNCMALSPSLLESELFGHEKGAFTGAVKRKLGRFELAKGGTIFLDEIGELPLDLQVKLLSVLQEKKFERVGGETTVDADIRIIAATNRNLKEHVENQKFRSDLYYRLNVIKITVPPLRERVDDIPALAKYFVAKYAAETNKCIERLSEEALTALMSYEWPGNVRELENAIERAVVLEASPIIGTQFLPPEVVCGFRTAAGSGSETPVESSERRLLCSVLEQCDWSRSRAAQRLKMSRTTLWRRMKKYGLETKLDTR